MVCGRLEGSQNAAKAVPSRADDTCTRRKPRWSRCCLGTPGSPGTKRREMRYFGAAHFCAPGPPTCLECPAVPSCGHSLCDASICSEDALKIVHQLFGSAPRKGLLLAPGKPRNSDESLRAPYPPNPCEAMSPAEAAVVHGPALPFHARMDLWILYKSVTAPIPQPANPPSSRNRCSSSVIALASIQFRCGKRPKRRMMSRWRLACERLGSPRRRASSTDCS